MTKAGSGGCYPTGRTICNIVNSFSKKTVLLCFVEATPGSVCNIEALATGEQVLSIVQSDMLSIAFNGQLR